MAERVPVKSGERPREGLEIIDSEKLGKYGALYGRFLLASLPKAEIESIINPDKPVEVSLTEDAIKNRNYNPVFQNLSFVEREQEWKDFTPSTVHPTAYSQWRRDFTSFMVNIQDSQREKALKAILSNNKEAKEFTVNDADTLFKEFCSGKSDINNFIGRVTANLASRNKINPAYLQELLPHLQWIASGLFGKNTASQIATRLIELESALHNNPGQVMEFFNSNKERINMPTDDEKKILIPLYQSLIRQEDITVAIKPTPVTPKPSEDKGGKDNSPDFATTIS